MMVDTPIKEHAATKPTPINSPYIIGSDRLIPILIPKFNDNIIHMPGDILTAKKVGINNKSNEKSIRKIH